MRVLMLLSYSVENYKGFKNKQEFSLIASSGNEYNEYLYTLPNGVRVNTFACVIGPNGSGKTHLLESLYILSFLMKQREIGNVYAPFLLDKKSHKSPITFEIILYNPDDERLYRYGIRINKNEIIDEWLYTRTLTRSAKEMRIFNRPDGKLSFNPKFSSLEKLLNVVSTKASIVSFSDSVVSKELSFVRIWAEKRAFVNSDIAQIKYIENILVPQDKKGKQNVFNIITQNLNHMGIPIKEISIEEIEGEEILTFYLECSDGELLRIKKTDAFNFFSRGTLDTIFFVSFLTLSSSSGISLSVDEIDGAIHYKLANEIVELIRTSARLSIEYGAPTQVFFTTHNIHLLDEKMRRDEIFIITKDEEQSSVISRGSDFSVRKQAKLSAKYLNNEFGGLPKFLKGDIDE